MGRQVKTRRAPFEKVRQRAHSEGATACFWCRRPFGDRRPPTRDHVNTTVNGLRFPRGGFVYTCEQCNNARGAMLFDDYAELVVAEHRAACIEDRLFVAPRGY